MLLFKVVFGSSMEIIPALDLRVPKQVK